MHLALQVLQVAMHSPGACEPALLGAHLPVDEDDWQR
jgi:hypothetical protein